MATLKATYSAQEFTASGNETFPSLDDSAPASAVPRILALMFDAAGTEAAQIKMEVSGYGSGDATILLRWKGDTATSGDVVWGVTVGFYTPDTDTGSVEAITWGTEATVTDTHLGTTALRMMVTAGTTVSLSGLAAGDIAYLRVRRIGGNGSDTMTGDAGFVDIEVAYSDT